MRVVVRSGAFDARAARVPHLVELLLLASRRRHDVIIHPEAAERWHLGRRLEAHAARALVRGLANLPASLARGPGNAFLVSVELEVSLLEALEERRRGTSGVPDPNAMLHRFQISSPAWEAHGRGDAKAFIEDRRQVLESIERNFLHTMGLPPRVAQ